MNIHAEFHSFTSQTLQNLKFKMASSKFPPILAVPQLLEWNQETSSLMLYLLHVSMSNLTLYHIYITTRKRPPQARV